MKQRFCPVCDTKLGNGRFCPVCKKWVRHPVYMDGDFYLNESHPVNERDCEYHAIINGYKIFDDQEKEAKKDKKTKERQKKPVSASYAAREKASYQKKNRKKNGRLSLVLLIIAAYIIVRVAIAVAEHKDQIVSVIEQAVEEQGTWETEWYGTADVAEYDGAEGDMAASGERCTGYGHFSAVKEDISSLIGPWLAEQGWTTLEVMDEVYEESAYDDGSIGEESPFTYWDSSQCFWFDTGDGEEGYVEIDYDAVSGEIHYINFELPSRDNCTDLLKMLEGPLGITASDIEMFLGTEPDEDGWIWIAGESCTILAGDGVGTGMWYGNIAPY